MLALLPLLWFGLAYLLLVAAPGRSDERALSVRLSLGRLGCGEALLYAALAFGVVIVVSTELLGLAHALTRGWVALVWMAGVVLLAAIVLNERRKGRADLGNAFPRLAGKDRVVVGAYAGTTLIVLVLGVIAWVAAPNNWDSLAYHLPRVSHWQQQRSLSFYATNIEGQLHLTPGAEFIILHLRLLTRTDRLDNFVQWAAMVLALVTVARIGEQLKLGARGQAVAVVVAATIPMGILQATSTQSDYVVALWLAIFVWLVLKFSPSKAGNKIKADQWVSVGFVVPLGAALGLAIFTKATAYVFGLPFVMLLIVKMLRGAGRGAERQWAKVALGLGFVAVVALALNSGQYARNLKLYGSPLGPSGEGAHGETSYINGVFSPSELASNLIRDSALNLGTPFDGINRRLQRLVVDIHRVIGIGVDDPRTNFGGTLFSVRRTSNGEDTAGSPLHLLLAVPALCLLLTRRRYRREPHWAYAAAIVGGWCLFALLLRWQPWSAHFELVAFLLAAPVIAVVAQDVPVRIIGSALVGVLLVAAIPWVVANRYRPLLGRAALFETTASIFEQSRGHQYFVHRPEVEDNYRRAALLVLSRRPERVGTVLHFENWEYPLWLLLHAEGHRRPELVNTLVDQPSRTLERPGPFDAVICVECRPNEHRRLVELGYEMALPGVVEVFFPSHAAAPSSPTS